MLVVSTTSIGFVLGSKQPWELFQFPLGKFIFCAIGTGLCAGSASILNQLLEKKRDGIMKRTQERPLPQGRIGPKTAWAFGLMLAWLGSGILAINNGLLASALGILTIFIYAALYTPMKPITNLNTLVGALVGALPPLIGWAAARQSIDLPGIILAGILFFWQLPHFLALSWLYKEDYKQAGFQMLGGNDDDELSGRISFSGALFLIPLCLMLFKEGTVGITFTVLSLILNVSFLFPAWKFFQTRTNKNAKFLFKSSLIYLPTLMIFILIDYHPYAKELSFSFFHILLF